MKECWARLFEANQIIAAVLRRAEDKIILFELGQSLFQLVEWNGRNISPDDQDVPVAPCEYRLEGLVHACAEVLAALRVPRARMLPVPAPLVRAAGALVGQILSPNGGSLT